MNFFNYSEAPETLVSILRCLGETMTVHVACTTWDKQFRLALVASSLPIDYKFESQEFYTKKSVKPSYKSQNVCLKFNCGNFRFLFSISWKVLLQLVGYGANYYTHSQHFVIIVINTAQYQMNCQLLNKLLFFIVLV